MTPCAELDDAIAKITIERDKYGSGTVQRAQLDSKITALQAEKTRRSCA